MSFGQSVELVLNVKYLLLLSFFYCSHQVLQFGAHSRYYKGALTQKRSFLVISDLFFMLAEKNENKHSTLNSSFDKSPNDMNQT